MENRHYAVIDPYTRLLKLYHEGKLIAETKNAMLLKEVGKSVYDPVFYIPKEDLQVELETDTRFSSHCPIKGDASYWTTADYKDEEYFIWSYDSALPRAKKINGMVAFNMSKVSFTSDPI